jgi:hypothetical protein
MLRPLLLVRANDGTLNASLSRRMISKTPN